MSNHKRNTLIRFAQQFEQARRVFKPRVFSRGSTAYLGFEDSTSRSSESFNTCPSRHFAKHQLKVLIQTLCSVFPKFIKNSHKCPRNSSHETKSNKKQNCNCLTNTKNVTLTFCLNTKKQSVLINSIWDEPAILPTEFISRTMNWFIEINLKFQKHTKASLKPPWMNGSNLEW